MALKPEVTKLSPLFLFQADEIEEWIFLGLFPPAILKPEDEAPGSQTSDYFHFTAQS